MQSKSEGIDILLKQVCVQYFYAVIITTFLFAVYYWYADIEPLNYVVSICMIVHMFLIVVPYKLSYESIKPLLPAYLTYISIFLYANTLFFWPFLQATAFMWYSIVPIATMLFFKRKTVIFSSIYVFLVMCSVFFVSYFIPEGYYNRPTDNQLMIINIMTIILSIGFMLLFIYYLIKMNALRESWLNMYEIKDKKEEDEENTEKNRYDNLYNEIHNYFSEKKPYCNPDYTILQLAEDIDSNVKYISRAIKLKENVNFSVFINIYRIKLVKELIAMNYHNKYTIKYIYISAGFRHQSTFNKVFKDIVGATPSEYIKNNKRYMPHLE